MVVATSLEVMEAAAADMVVNQAAAAMIKATTVNLDLTEEDNSLAATAMEATRATKILEFPTTKDGERIQPEGEEKSKSITAGLLLHAERPRMTRKA